MKRRKFYTPVVVSVLVILFYGLTLTNAAVASTWQIETVTNVNPGTASQTSIATDWENNKAHISFYDFSNKALKYATNASGSWVITTIQSGIVADTDTSIDRDENGKIHIAYEGSSGNLMYATNTSGTWTTTIVDAGVWPTDPSIGVDDEGTVYISYFDLINFDLKLATYSGGLWQKSVIVNGSVTGQMPYYSSSLSGCIADNTVKVYVSYYDDSYPDSIKYVTNESGSWQSYMVDTIGLAAGWETSISVQNNCVVHLTYYDWTNDQLKYATNAPGTWQKTVVSGSNDYNVWDSSMRVDDETGIAYISYTSGGLKFATNSSGSWQTEVVDAGSAGRSALALGKGGTIHISYLEYTGSGLGYELKYAQRTCVGGQPFSDVPSTHWAFDYIEAIKEAGITTGCGSGCYCPDNQVTREQMAAFIIRALCGETFTYDPAPYFVDVPSSHWAFKYIQKLKELGITTGCGSDTYCPGSLVTREQMAAFLIRAKIGEDFSYDPNPYFTDVTSDHWAFDYIQKLKELGITTGCGSGQYCPDEMVTRDQMAAFLYRAFLQ